MNSSESKFTKILHTLLQTSRVFIGTTILFLPLIYACDAQAQNVISNTALSPSGLIKEAPKLTIEKLTQQSEIIAIGKVAGMESEWNEDHSSIRTRVKVMVDETIKGTASESSIVIIIPGGEVDGVGELYTHSVQFQKNEDVVVFAHVDNKGHLRITNGEQGKFHIQKDEKTGSKIIPHLGTLEDFTKQVKRIVKPNAEDLKKE